MLCVRSEFPQVASVRLAVTWTRHLGQSQDLVSYLLLIPRVPYPEKRGDLAFPRCFTILDMFTML